MPAVRMILPPPTVTEMLRVWMQNRKNFAQICFVIGYSIILKAAAVKGIQNRSDWTDEVSDSSTRIRAK